MDEIAFVSFEEAEMPANPAELRDKLIANGLTGNYRIVEDSLHLQGEDGVYEFTLAEAEPDLGLAAGIDVAGDFEDEAAVIIDLSEIFEDAFPGCEFSSAYD